MSGTITIENFKTFTNCYPVSKTLKFKLIPQGKTLENMTENKIVEKDILLLENAQLAKKLLDMLHRDFIERTLEDFFFDSELTKCADLYYQFAQSKTMECKQLYEESQDLLRKQLANHFKENGCEELFGKTAITELLPLFIKNNPTALATIDEFKDFDPQDATSKALEIITSFQNFTSYFTSYYQTRKNLYSAEKKTNTIAYRLINENLPCFLDNMQKFETQKEFLKEEIEQLNKNMLTFIGTKKIEDFFCLQAFNEAATQRGITLYNLILGGYSEEDGNHVQGLNSLINIYNQKNKDFSRLFKMQQLNKQLLSKADSFSYIPPSVSSDDELLDIIKIFTDSFMGKETVDIHNIKDLKNILLSLASCDLSKIYVERDSLTKISQKVYKNWYEIPSALHHWYDNVYYSGRKKYGTDAYEKERAKYFNNQACYSLAFLNEVLKQYPYANSFALEDYFSPNFEFAKEVFSNVLSSYKELEKIFRNRVLITKNLKKDQRCIHLIKNFFDDLKALESFVKPLFKETLPDKDAMFYEELDAYAEVFRSMDLLYNRTRNYLTRKPFSTEKTKLNFENASLLSGWDLNKETSNGAVILRKDGYFYLGIMPKHNMKSFVGDYPSDGDTYEKMEYKLIPDPVKMLPKVFFSAKGLQTYNPPERVYTNYKKGTHKKGDLFCLEDMHALIDFYKEAINKNESWSVFNFKFSDTKSYEDMSQFYKDVTDQSYNISFRNVSVSYIDTLVETGQLYLFQIYNKDFSKYSKGTENLFTKYFRELFSEENLADVVYKLNGSAEMFYRRASISKENRIIHPANEPVANKRDSVKKEKPYSMFTYDLIKNKRYTLDQFEFHISLTMNYKAPRYVNMNQKVNEFIKETDGLYIIGINRGERNLIQVAVIDFNGNLVKEASFNTIYNEFNNQIYTIDYAALLDKKANEREEARKNWDTIENIKDLKTGYLSQVIHEILKIFEEYPGIIVMEDLSTNFKQSRQKIEKQIYQKFESMLISKLTYYVNKKKEKKEVGGVLNALQLTFPTDSMQRFGNQNGILFFASPWFISNIDPTTGFVNLFDTRYKNISSAKEFFGKFDRISFNKVNGYFEFVFDYKNFTSKLNDTRTAWIVCSHGERIKTFRNSKKNNQWDSETIYPTEELKKIFEEYNINIDLDLKEQILSQNEKSFFVELLNIFGSVVQMRNSVFTGSEDYFVSPVKNESTNTFYDSRIGISGIPASLDGLAAYHIAQKGLWMLDQIRDCNEDKKPKLYMKNEDWLNWLQ